MFAKFASKFKGASARIAGKTDLLEAVAAAAAWIAAADGDISDSEIDTAMGALTSHEVLSAAFSVQVIEATMDKMIKRANAGRAGRSGLKKEIQDICGNESYTKDDLELVFCVAIDVADDDGIDDDERKVLDKIGDMLGLKVSDYE